MTIASEITRLQTAKSDIKTAINGTGLIVADSEKIDEYYKYIQKLTYIPPPKTFTVSWTETSNPNNWRNTYSDDAAGLTAGSTAFDDFFAYEAVVIDDNGNLVGNPMKQTGGVFSDTMTNFINGKSGNVMIRFPKRGIKMTKSGSTVTLSITSYPDKASEGYQYYAFNSNGVPSDYLYLGAYKGSLSNSKLVSVSGTSSIGNFSLDSATAATNQYTNKRYHEITYYARHYINALYKMKYANPNSQSVVGMGYVGGRSARSTGGTNSQTSATYGTSSKTQQVKLFGLEDWRGNVWEWLDGAYYSNNRNLQVSKTQAFASTGRMTSYDTNITVNYGYMSSAVATNEGMFASNGTSGTTSTYYCDFFGTSSGYWPLVGGAWDGGSDVGAFFGSIGAASAANSFYGARLMYL